MSGIFPRELLHQAGLFYISQYHHIQMTDYSHSARDQSWQTYLFCIFSAVFIAYIYMFMLRPATNNDPISYFSWRMIWLVTTIAAYARRWINLESMSLIRVDGSYSELFWQGRADVSFTEGNFQTPTPTIDRLAWEGIILNRHYSDSICSPTRASLLTGKYTIHTGSSYDRCLWMFMTDDEVFQYEERGLTLAIPPKRQNFSHFWSAVVSHIMAFNTISWFQQHGYAAYAI